MRSSGKWEYQLAVNVFKVGREGRKKELSLEVRGQDDYGT